MYMNERIHRVISYIVVKRNHHPNRKNFQFPLGDFVAVALSRRALIFSAQTSTYSAILVQSL